MLSEMQKRLEDDLQAYDMILAVETEDDGSKEGFAGRLLDSQVLRQTEKKVLVLSAEKSKELVELYYTYEFSDRVRVLGGSKRHGSLINYVDDGLMTEQEAFELILQ